MSFRSYLEQLDAQGRLVRVTQPVSRQGEIAAILKGYEPRAVLFESVLESPFQVVGNLFCTKESIAAYFGIPKQEMIPNLSRAIDARSTYQMVDSAPCQEVVQLPPNLDQLPILKHFPRDGGNYLTSGVTLARHPVYGQNADFHRCMQFSPTEMAMRVVESRHFDRFLAELGEVEVAVCVGNAPNVLLAAATSVDLGVDELEIANALEPLKVTPARTVNLLVPADCEFVLEGTVSLTHRHAEGPFVDLTETQDFVRQEPVFTLRAITHRKDAFWHALLPGGLEHKLLMGTPREPTIFREVNRVARCLDVNITPGGCSWLHAVVQIDKHNEVDGQNAIQAAFKGHRSCKHVYVVDADIDIYNPQDVEWALATRFQGDRSLFVQPRQRGSSLDPSAEPDTCLTTKIGFDLTRPLGAPPEQFRKVTYPPLSEERLRELGLELSGKNADASQEEGGNRSPCA